MESFFISGLFGQALLHSTEEFVLALYFLFALISIVLLAYKWAKHKLLCLTIIVIHLLISGIVVAEVICILAFIFSIFRGGEDRDFERLSKMTPEEIAEEYRLREEKRRKELRNSIIDSEFEWVVQQTEKEAERAGYELTDEDYYNMYRVRDSYKE